MAFRHLVARAAVFWLHVPEHLLNVGAASDPAWFLALFTFDSHAHTPQGISVVVPAQVESSMTSIGWRGETDVLRRHRNRYGVAVPH